jgi:hypothetical protein
MRVRKITAFLDKDDEVGEAFRLVGLRAITLPMFDEDGSVWLAGQLVDSERELRVRLSPHGKGERDTVFEADFGPVGSGVFAIAVLGRLLPKSLGEQVYIQEVLTPSGDMLCKMVSASVLATHRMCNGSEQPKYQIELA